MMSLMDISSQFFMKKYLSLLLLGVSFNFATIGWGNSETVALEKTKTRKTGIIGKLKNSPGPDTGCSFKWKEKAGEIFWWGAGNLPATMNIDGKDQQLNFITRTESHKIGDRSIFFFQSGKTTVLFDLIQATVCVRGDTECEGVSYDATITARVGNRQQTVLAEGYCGS
jgi:hypothetical protein